MIHKANSGHTGGSLSAIDVLTTLYYGESKKGKFFNTDPKNPDWDDQDYFILSKGHSCPALYVILADLGFFNKSELDHFRQVNALLQGHPVRKIPGVTMTTGTLGSGITVAVGLAMCLKMEKKSNKVYCMIGDGEAQEGVVWEALMSAGHNKLDNLVVILDYNGVQMDGFSRTVMSLDPVVEKFEAFNFSVIPVINGHDTDEIGRAFAKAQDITRKPVMIIANTIKGKGVGFAENKPSYHGVALSKEEMAEAIPVIEQIIDDCK